MNTAALKEFAPAARKMLLKAVKNRALKVGVSANGIEEATVSGDYLMIGQIRLDRQVAEQRTRLVQKVNKMGFDAAMEEVAYTWFNRLMALRYMEVHGYLSHGYRVLSHPSQDMTPEILQHALDVNLPGLDTNKVAKLTSEGKREELYQLLLITQCHELNKAMPFMFDRIDGATELLTPDGLLASDSIIRRLVTDIDEQDWKTTEILGWLYQFYISDKKAEVDAYVKKGKAVEPEDIPAKTQLFTPNWIVQFLTQNSLGRLWMDVYPDSPLKEKMPFYTAPAEQEPEVVARLKAITPASLDPTELTAIDPAAGSGHILLELYNLFFEMYKEQGYRPADIPRQIVEKNLFGLELDARAAQIASFAVLMRARADDPRLLDNPPKLNIFPIRHSRDLNLGALLSPRQAEVVFASTRLFEDDQPKLQATGNPLFSDARLLWQIKELFKEADIVGSLIRIPTELADKLDDIGKEIEAAQESHSLFEQDELRELSQLVNQARLLSRTYVVAAMNPPYMGGKSRCKDLKQFLESEFDGYEKDVFAAFIIRAMEMTARFGYMGFMSPFTWMFISTFEELRKYLITNTQLSSWIQLEYSGFAGATVPICTFTMRNHKCKGEKGTYIRLSDFKGAENQAPRTLEAIGNPSCGWLYRSDQDEFKKIPGWPIAYFTSDRVREIFQEGVRLESIAKPRVGLQTGKNAEFVRFWWEVDRGQIGLLMNSRDDAKTSGLRWFPYNKGGEYRRWFGNQEDVVDWEDDGLRIRNCCDSHGKQKSRPQNTETYFRLSASWTFVTSGKFAIRHYPRGFIYDVAGSSLFSDKHGLLELITCQLNSSLAKPLLADFAPTLNFQVGDVGNVPILKNWSDYSKEVVKAHDSLVGLAKRDWNDYETSWDFAGLEPKPLDVLSVVSWWQARMEHCQSLVDQTVELEQANNVLMASIYKLEDEVEVSVNRKDISLWANPEHVFRPKRKRQIAEEDDAEEAEDNQVAEVEASAEELARKFRAKGISELVSYSLGCMMGRYSLDEPGLIYALESNEGFDPDRYKTFRADDDAIIPITDQDYFLKEDIANRFSTWVSTVWPPSSAHQNLEFIAQALGQRGNENPLETLRRYFVDEFYADHLQTYKKRPIYWLFSSGRKKAFQALVYLHRYNSTTLSRMRSAYVQPLIGKLQIQTIQAEDNAKSAFGAQKVRLTKQARKLRDQLDELLEFDEKLLFFALQQIELDLDDGVKVNYGKFSDPKVGDILAKVKEITGGKDD